MKIILNIIVAACIYIANVNAKLESVSLAKRQLLSGNIELLEKAGGHYERGDPMTISIDDIGKQLTDISIIRYSLLSRNLKTLFRKILIIYQQI